MVFLSAKIKEKPCLQFCKQGKEQIFNQSLTNLLKKRGAFSRSYPCAWHRQFSDFFQVVMIQ